MDIKTKAFLERMNWRQVREFFFRKVSIWILLGFVILISGLVAGIILVRQRQLIQQMAAANTILYIQPVNQTTTAGNPVSFSVRMDTGSNQVTGIDLVLDYNPAVFSLTGIQRGSGSANLDQQVKAAVIDNTAGQVSWSIFTLDRTKALQGSGVEMFTVSGTVKSTAVSGTYNITFDNKCAASAVGEGVNVLSGSTAGGVTVQGTVTPGPTVTPTRTPTPTPGRTSTPRPTATPTATSAGTPRPTALPTQTPTVPPGGGGGSVSGLVGWWKFDEGTSWLIRDSSGQANTGFTKNGPTWVSGRFNRALSFDKVDDYVNLGSNPPLDNLANFTWSAWIYPRSYGENSRGRIIGKGSGGGWEKALYLDNADADGVYGTLYFNFNNSRGSNFITYSRNNSIVLRAWQHVAVTFSYSTDRKAHLFIDGREVSYAKQATMTGSPWSDSPYYLVVGNRLNTDRTFDGIIDDVRVYNRALTPSEVNRLAQATTSTLGVSTEIDSQIPTPTATATPAPVFSFWQKLLNFFEKL